MKENIDPKMHTAEHILNQTMVRLFNSGRCFSAHIEKKKSKCDYHFGRSLTAEEIQKIEDQINETVKQNLEVKEEFISLDEANSNYDLKRLPDGIRPDSVRVIKVGDYDAVPCSGPHVELTSELGHFKIISSDFNNEILRVRYRLL